MNCVPICISDVISISKIPYTITQLSCLVISYLYWYPTPLIILITIITKLYNHIIFKHFTCLGIKLCNIRTITLYCDFANVSFLVSRICWVERYRFVILVVGFINWFRYLIVDHILAWVYKTMLALVESTMKYKRFVLNDLVGRGCVGPFLKYIIYLVLTIISFLNCHKKVDGVMLRWFPLKRMFPSNSCNRASLAHLRRTYA